MRKSITVVANTTGWYTIKTTCDEGSVFVNMKLEAGKPTELFFSEDRARYIKESPIQKQNCHKKYESDLSKDERKHTRPRANNK